MEYLNPVWYFQEILVKDIPKDCTIMCNAVQFCIKLSVHSSNKWKCFALDAQKHAFPSITCFKLSGKSGFPAPKIHDWFLEKGIFNKEILSADRQGGKIRRER